MNPFLGQIMLFAGNFAPRGWAFCHGQLLPISQNTALFSILGTTYGGDGRTTFGLPDLMGRQVIHKGRGPGLPTYNLGEKVGHPNTILSVANLPASGVVLRASTDEGTTPEPGPNTYVAVMADDAAVYYTSADTTLKPGNLVGAQNTAFSNQSPYLGMNYIVALQGTYPSRS